MHKASSFRNEVRRDIPLEQENVRQEIGDIRQSSIRNPALPIVYRHVPQIEDVFCCVPNMFQDSPQNMYRRNSRAIPELCNKTVLI